MGYSFFLTFLVSFSALLLMRPLAVKVGLVDKPNYRKRHQGAIPLIGGLALFIGNLCFYFLVWQQMQLPYLYLSCISVLLVMGVLDDRYDISPFLRAGIQALLALSLVFIGNLSLNSLGELIGPFQFQLGSVSIVITMLATVAIINAFNMIDGIDGLLGGLSCVSFIAISVLLMIDNQWSLAYWCIALVCCLVPYMLFNLSLFGSQRKVFMGDSGSTLIGFTMIWILLLSTQGKGHPMNPVTALWIIAVPLVDLICVVFRRLRKGKSPFRPDRLHIHHLMMRAGLSSRQAFMIITLFSACLATFGVLGEIYYINEWLMFLAFIALIFIYSYMITRAWRVTRFIRRVKRRLQKAKKYQLVK